MCEVCLIRAGIAACLREPLVRSPSRPFTSDPPGPVSCSSLKRRLLNSRYRHSSAGVAGLAGLIAASAVAHSALIIDRRCVIGDDRRCFVAASAIAS